MGLRAWNVAVLIAVASLWLATGTHTEKSLLPVSEKSAAVKALESDMAAHPTDEATLLKLASAYLDSKAPGLAVHLLESAPLDVRKSTKVDHLYARALIDQGRNRDALQAELRVLSACDEAKCPPVIITSANRRVAILRELVRLGVEDATADPEMSSVAYHNATREAHVEVEAP